MIKLICAIGIAVFWLIVVTLVTITSLDTLYYCDPEKNTECPKTHCHINGGDCRLTTHRKYRRKNENTTRNHSRP